MSNRFLFLLVFFIVFISRLPFLDAGYGNSSDGWRVASTARYISTAGEYKASRFPGFPIVEIACSLVWKHGAWAMNLLSSLASAVAAAILSLIAKYYGCRDSVLIAVTFAFTPIVFISSTITMDYLWAMMFVMLTWYAGLMNKPIIAGLFLGMAVGCRITTVFFVMPFSLLFIQQSNWKQRLSDIIKFWIATSIGSLIIFIPVIRAYGIHFVTDYRRDSFPPFVTILRFIAIDVWGFIGFLAVVLIPLWMVINRQKNIDASISQKISRDHVNVWIAGLALVAVGFALHPMKSAYVIPAIPFLLMLSAYYLTRTQCIVTCLLIILSSFIVSFDSTDRPWSTKPSPYSMKIDLSGRMIAINFLRGPIFHDHVQRKHYIEYVRKVIDAGDRLVELSTVIVGPWLPFIIEMTPNTLPESEFSDYSLQRGNVEYISILTPEFLVRSQHAGRRLFYLTTVDHYNKNILKLDIVEAGAVELNVE